jgi:hypothetical protein
MRNDPLFRLIITPALALAVLAGVSIKLAAQTALPVVELDISYPGNRAQARGNESEILKVVTALPVEADAAVIAWLKERREKLIPHFMLELAKRMFRKDRDEAAAWYLLGLMRTRYEYFRCSDQTAHQGAMMLPMFAQEVANYVINNADAAARAMTTALDWESSFSESARPVQTLGFFACIHGIRAMSQGLAGKPPPAPLYVDSSEWPGIRQRIRDATQRNVLALGQPAFDHPMAARPLVAKRMPVKDNAKFSWFNSRRLVFEERTPRTSPQGPPPESKLFAWDGETPPKLIVTLTKHFNWCAGANRLSYVIDANYSGEGADRTTTLKYREGTLTEQREATFSFRSKDPSPDMGANYLNCSYDPIERRAKGRRLLAEPDGHLDFDENPNSEVPIRWTRPGSAPIDLPLPGQSATPECTTRYDSEGYFLWPCGAGRHRWASWSETGCNPAAYLRSDGRVEKLCLPTLKDFRFYYGSALPSRMGVIFSTTQRDHPAGSQPGGLYRRTKDGFEKMLEDRVWRAILSPDRCRIAFITQPAVVNGPRDIGVIDLCKK